MMKLSVVTVVLLAVRHHGVQALPFGPWLDSAAHYFGHLFHRQSFVAFDIFLDRVRNSTFGDFSSTAVVDEVSFTEMKQRILAIYGGVNVTNVTSFVLDGEYCDCIQLMQQPSVHLLGLDHIEAPPSFVPPDRFGDGGAEATNISLPAPSVLDLGLRDPFGNPVSCPDNTVPIQRLTLESVSRFSTLRDFDWKPPVHLLNADGSVLVPRGVDDARADRVEKRLDPNKPIHLHAFAWESKTNYGLNSWIDLWSPNTDLSFSQQWVLGNVSGSLLQTVEGGWVVYKKRWGSKARLFTIYTADDYGKLSCYNHDCGTFTQTNSHWYLGGPWDRYSIYGGQQWGFEMQWQLYQGNWWLLLRGPGAFEPVGYYPGKVFNGGPLTRSATDVVFGGEVANISSKPAYHHGPMGSGHFAEEGWTRAAYQNRIFRVIRSSSGENIGVWAALKPILQTWLNCYTMAVTPWQQGGTWGTYMYFGGPGGDNCWNGQGP